MIVDTSKWNDAGTLMSKLSAEERKQLVVLIAAFDKADKDAETYSLSGKADGFDVAKEIVAVLKTKLELKRDVVSGDTIMEPNQ